MELEKARQARQQTLAGLQAQTNSQARLEGQLALLAGQIENLGKLTDGLNRQGEIARRAQADLDQERKKRDAVEAKLKAEAETARKAMEQQIADLEQKAATLETQARQNEKSRK